MNCMYDTLVLSGGGCKGMIQIGALDYLYFKKNVDIFNIKYFYGTSIGAVVCLLLACDIEPCRVYENFCESCNEFPVNSAKKNLISLDVFLLRIEELIFNSMGYIPSLLQMKTKMGKYLTFTSYCLEDKECVYISYETFPHISCMNAVKMSCAIPYIFDEVKIDNKTYIDGGIADNFPLEIALKWKTVKYKIFEPKKILGILVEDDFYYENTFTSYTINVFMIPIISSNKKALAFAEKMGVPVIKILWKNNPRKMLYPDRRELRTMFTKGQIEVENQLKI
ncbi:MAG TPA: patatin-like phospholipase family protein [Nitrosarchaeum sp.]|nr:patatin-like phospholipase family protein [Nitrosarchaeum sp.]